MYLPVLYVGVKTTVPSWLSAFLLVIETYNSAEKLGAKTASQMDYGCCPIITLLHAQVNFVPENSTLDEA